MSAGSTREVSLCKITRIALRATLVSSLLALLFTASLPAQAQVVYSNNFETTAGAEWSNPSLATTPNGRRFLGEFDNGMVSLMLSGLPAHMSASVHFDLYVIRSWDGNPGLGGPDIWQWGIEGGPTVVQTTFNNGHPFTIGNGQAYPQSFGVGSNPARTGAAENNSLGYLFIDGIGRNFGPMDSVYHMQYDAFPHTDGSLKLNFTGIGLQGIADESWGLDNVTVSVAGGPSPVPEPCSMVLLGSGVLGLLQHLRRRRAV
jgi:hypothetical protein